jgi:hypothetical protein
LSVVAVVFGAARGWSADAAPRGLLDSVVTTLIGGNTGNGATDATTMPLTSLGGGIARDSAGVLYYTDNNRIIKQNGAAVTVFAGQLVSGSAAEGVSAANARFSSPTLLAIDASNNLYVLDQGNGRIRKIDTNGIVTTVAGNGTMVFQIADIGRIATDANLPNSIGGLAVNAAGDIFIGARGISCIYKIAAADKRLALIAGDGTAGQSRSGSSVVNAPLGGQFRDLALLGDGTLIYSTSSGAIRNLKADGTSVVIAGVLDSTVAAPGNDVTLVGTLYPDDGTKSALQTITATVTVNQVGGVNPGALAVDGGTIFFFDQAANRIRSFTVGGTIKTVFGEVTEGGQSSLQGFRGEGTLAAPSTPRLGVVVTAGPNGIIDSVPGGDDVVDNTSRPARIFAGANNTSNTTVAGDDIQVVANGAAATDDQTPRNDDPRLRVSNGRLVAAGGVVTFVDDQNFVVRQFTVGSTVNTIAGATNAIRRNNFIPLSFHQKLSTNAAMPALGAPIFSPSQVARSSTGGLFFDASDIQGNHNIYQFDPTASTITVIAGNVTTNGYRSSHGDGGPAATAKLTGLGTQVSVLADGTVLFADTNPQTLVSGQTIRAVSPAGVISTVCGKPGLSGNRAPDVDFTTVLANGNPVNPNLRVGQKATDVLLNTPFSVVGTSTSDFVVADEGNSRLLVVAGGNITVDQFVPGLAYLAPLSATVVVTASAPGGLTRIDYTNPAAITTTNAVSLANCRGIATGTIGGTAVVFVLGGGNQIDVRNAATLAQFYTIAPLTAVLPGGVNVTGFASNGTNLAIADASGTQIRTLALSLFTAGTSAPVPTGAQFPVVAGQFSNVLVNGYNLQTNFQFTNFTPVAFLGADILVGDDGVTQYRRITLGATAPQSTFTVVAGTGSERIGGADGGPATATSIGPVEGIAVDANGAVFFTDGTDITVRKVAGGIISVFAGIPGRSASNQPNNVNALQSCLSSSMGGLAFSPTGELHIADTGNNIVRKVMADGTIVTVAGIDEGIAGENGEGGNPLAARLADPHKIVFNANGDLYIGENISSLGRLHIVSTANIITTLAGGGADSMDYNPISAFEVSLSVAGLTIDTAGKIYVSDGSASVGRIADGLAQLVIGDPIAAGFNGDGLPGIQTLLAQPRGLAFDPTLGLIIVDTGNNRVRAVTNLAETTNTPPTAVIVATPGRLGVVPFKVHFDGTTSVDPDGDIVTYVWDFGDGGKGNGPTVDHTYTAQGMYTVTLKVTDSQGQSNSTTLNVFAAAPVISSQTTGKGAFKIAFGPKAVKPSDSFAIQMQNVSGLSNQVGKAATIFVGSFSIKATVGGKGIKSTNKNVSLLIDPVKKTVTVSIKGVKMTNAFAEMGVINQNTIAPAKPVLIPVVVNVANTLVIGDSFLFLYTSKFNSGASGKFSQ